MNLLKVYTLRNLIVISMLFSCCLLNACQKYLDAKPDKSLAVPATVADYQAILDNDFLNTSLPLAGDMACDDYFIKSPDLSGFDENAQLCYLRDPKASYDYDWQYSYENIEDCNVVIDGIAHVAGNPPASAVAQIKGSALFLRAYYFFQLANVYAMPYNPANAGYSPGIPLRLSSDITVKSIRSTNRETFQRIVEDLRTAASLLPVTPKVKTRPSKPAAYGALARAYLVMQDYADANLYADSCLALYDKLMDYNDLDSTAFNPIAQFNDEVIFHATTSGQSGMLDPYYARVDTDLYSTYLPNDTRKNIFYSYAGDGYYAFKGDYTGQSFGQLFNGIAVDEILLIRAETYVRLGQIAKGIDDLNLLLSKRYKRSQFTPYAENMPNALEIILTERRKELAFRSEIRWSDLRRLNEDPLFAKTLVRKVNGAVYSLPSNDPRYAFLIPASVIQETGMKQNSR